MGEVCWCGGEGKVILVMLPVHRKSLCTSLTGVKCVCMKGLGLCLQWSGHLCVTPCDGWGVCGGRGWVSCNVASAEVIFMYLLDRCEVCV